MKVIKKILLFVLVLVILLVAALVAIPYFFKDEIVAELKKATNENLNATVDFKDVDISLIRDFPNVSLKVTDYSVIGQEEFEGVKLAAGESFDVAVDFWSAYNFGEVPLQINSVDLVKPEMNVIILKNGKTNYDIAKETGETTTESTPFEIQLQSYSITDGHIIYDDRLWDTYVEMAGLNHNGKGDFTQDVFDLDTKTVIDELTAKAEGVTYLKKAKLDYTAGFNIDMPNSKYTLRENDLTINELQLITDGWLGLTEEGNAEVDLTFNAPSSDFKALLSMIPNAYIKGYENVKAVGKFQLDGFAKGVYSASPERYPTFKVNLSIANGDIKYPDLPIGISGINTDININSPTSDLDKMLVDISKFDLKVGNNPIQGFFKLKTPMSDPNVDTEIKGQLDLGDLVRAFPMEGVSTLNGKVDMDITAKARMSSLDKGDYEKVDMKGQASIENLNYVADGLPPVRIDALRTYFTPRNVQVSNFDMKLGKSDMSGSGEIDNILAYFSPDATMKGDFKLRSNYFNADEWLEEEEAVDGEQLAVGSGPASSEEELFNRFDFKVDAGIGKMDAYGYQLKDLKGNVQITPNKLTTNNLSGNIGDSDFAGSGVLTNIWDYVFKNGTIGGDLKVSSKYMNLNQFMTEEEVTTTSPTEATEPFLVPQGMDIHIDADMDKVIYDNMEMRNLNGGLVIADEAVTFEDVTTDLLGGKMAIMGGYDTKENEKPKFDLSMQLANMDFQKAFNTFNTFEAVAPIGKYIKGNFNTRFNISSILGKDMMPDLETITSEGFLHTINGKIAAFGPLEEIGNKLKVDAFKNFDIKNSKNWFSIANGALTLKEFDHIYEDIAMKIGGTHKITGSDMSYYIDAKIPREKIGKNPLGAAANTGLDLLTKEAAKVGLNVDAGEFVNVRIGISGSMTDPKIKIDFLGTEGKGESQTLKDVAVNTAKEEAERATAKAKAEAEKRLEEEKKKLTDQAKKEVDKVAADAKKKLEEEAKKRLEDEAKKKLEEEAKKLLGEEKKKKLEEEAKKKLEEWNPFKKKKDKGGGQ